MFGNPIGKKANGNLYKLLFIHFRFDAAMFDKYHAIDNISTEYSLEKVELEDARKALDDIEAEKEFIIEKQRKLEEEERAAQLLIIRYGNTGCGVFKPVLQNDRFLPKD